MQKIFSAEALNYNEKTSATKAQIGANVKSIDTSQAKFPSLIAVFKASTKQKEVQTPSLLTS